MHIGSMPVSQVRGVYNQSNRLVNSLFHYHSKPHLLIKQSNLHNKPTPPPQPQQSQCLALTALTPLTPSTTPRVCLSYIFTFLPSHHLSMHEMPSGTSFDHIYPHHHHIFLQFHYNFIKRLTPNQVPLKAQEAVPRGVEDKLPNSVHDTGASSTGNSDSMKQSHATGPSKVPAGIQKVAPKGLEEALPESIHPTN